MNFHRRTMLRGLASLAFPLPALVKPAGAADRVKIGFLLKTMQEERYQRDKAAFLVRAKALGAEVIFDSANNDEQTQLAAFENMLSRGAQAIVLQPVNTGTAGSMVTSARKGGVKVIGYDAMLVNGKLAPYLEVEPRKYRFRIMNGSNGRFFRFSFGDLLEFQQIGSDQGLLAAPIAIKRLVLAPGERGDLVFDFSGHAGQEVMLKSDSFDLVQFRVSAAPVSNGGELPAVLRPLTRIPETQAIKTRRLTLNEKMDMVQQSMGMLLNNTPWHMPITEKPVLGTTEIWELVNLTEDSHPIHLHLVKFQILDRRKFDTFEYLSKGTMRYLAPPMPPSPSDAGWKDIVRADSGLVTRIIVPFEGFTGRYVWHCHLLEHEDNEMMRPFEVVAS